MFRLIRIRAGFAHFCPSNTPRQFANNSLCQLLFQGVTIIGPCITGSYADPPNILPLLRSLPIQRAADTSRHSIKNTRIDHRRFEVAMAQLLSVLTVISMHFQPASRRGILAHAQLLVNVPSAYDLGCYTDRHRSVLAAKGSTLIPAHRQDSVPLCRLD